jgi:hypothetical protein
MNFSTAQQKLWKLVLFNLVKKAEVNVCIHCGKLIETVRELSIAHRQKWFDVNPDLFWDLDNIGFAHLHCNISDAFKGKKKTSPKQLAVMAAAMERSKQRRESATHEELVEWSNKARSARKFFGRDEKGHYVKKPQQ